MDKWRRGMLEDCRRRSLKVTNSENIRKNKGKKWQKSSRRQGISLSNYRCRETVEKEGGDDKKQAVGMNG